MACKGLSLMSGGLDSQLAIKVLQRAGAEVEAVCFTSPFFSNERAETVAAALGVKLHCLNFTRDICDLVQNPPHGFGGAMNPCIDCHATMIRRAGELMTRLGYDFVATGEVMGQRPMSQNKQALGVVAKTSGLDGRLVRPLSALLLAPTIPEEDGKLNRAALLDISGRCRDRQIALAKEFGIVDYPSPAGGCKLTEEGFSHKLKDLMAYEGLANERLVSLLTVGRHFRLPDGVGLIVGRDKIENAVLAACGDLGEVLDAPPGVPGPKALLLGSATPTIRRLAEQIILSYCKNATIDREQFKDYHIC